MTHIRKLPVRALGLALALSSLAAGAAPQTLQLLPSDTADRIPNALIATKSNKASDVDHAPVQFSWALDASAKLEAPKPYESASREYWTNVSAQELATGVAVRTTAPGALIRLSPERSANVKSLDPLSVVVSKGTRVYARGEAFATSSNSYDLKSAGADFPEGTLAFKLKDELGAGEFNVALPKAAGGYLVHVFEPNSTEILALAANQTAILSGEELQITARYSSGSAKTLGRVAGMITAPNGASVELRFESQLDGSFVAKTRLDALNGKGAGLWEAHTFTTTSDGQVQRDAKTAFAASVPTARLTGTAVIADAKAAAGGISVSLGVQAAVASRYNIAAVLYATDRSGQLVPAAIAHSANWLEAGASDLALSFATDTVRAQSLGAPFEVRDLTLTDQATLGLMEQRGRALRFTPR